MPSLSVVIPCKDDGPFLQRCLQALQSQTVAPLEIIVVDNDSSDDTPTIAATYGARVLHEHVPGIASAASAGYDAATGDVIARCDADSVPPPDWLERIHRRFQQEPDLALLTGPGVFYGTGRIRSRLAGIAYIQAYFLLMAAAMGHWPPFGSNCAFRRRDWEQARSRVNRLDQGVHDDVDLGFALDPTRRTAYDSSLKVGISARALAGGADARLRFKRAFHTLGIHWRQAPPWERWDASLKARRERRRRPSPQR
ncbi:glycosyltransferase involved in cell wall biosynthesis [Pseudarthrobacter defluvii]|uniref:glycosyltransferase family 2 protein n=1 Tax=Pseudarthrobacter defluvii TaxID=410837 RepID=UPI002781E3AD|nr:glycosyltransferase family 2 protein [Pseudarthrobacter defluvii]MDQ0768021.1 glycosyltransferase involved in cell wall biosynthesis [Pseudarthrobacter defluvii]